MPDRRIKHIPSVMRAKENGALPDQRRKHDEAFEAETLHLASESRSAQAAACALGTRSMLRYRWQQARVVAEMGSVEGATRDPEVRTLRAADKRPARELGI